MQYTWSLAKKTAFLFLFYYLFLYINSTQFIFTFLIDKLWHGSKAGKRLFVPLNKVNPFAISLPKDPTRLYPLALSKNYNERDQITFQLPAGYSIESLPKPTTIETEFGSYAVQIEQLTDTTVVYTRTLSIPIQTISAAQYNEVRLFFKNIGKVDNGKMVLVAK